MSDDQLNSALNLMRRMPPSSVENCLAGLIELVPDLTDELLNHVDQPLKVEKDPKTGKQYILCDYNRDGDSYRSPWSNNYYPEMDEGFLPSDRLRKLEVMGNALFDVYKKMYFSGSAVSSVYFFDTDDEESTSKSFGACFLIHKDCEPIKALKKGWWDSIHVFEAQEDKAGHFVYKLTTTVMVAMEMEDDKCGVIDLSGSMTKQSTTRKSVKDDEDHVGHLGKILEEMELQIRNAIEGIYIQKTRGVINSMRNQDAAKESEWEQITKSLNAAVINRG